MIFDCQMELLSRGQRLRFFVQLLHIKTWYNTGTIDTIDNTQKVDKGFENKNSLI